MGEPVKQKPMKVGVIGAGNVTRLYFANLQAAEEVDLYAISDLKPEAARQRAAEYEIPAVYSTDELFTDPEVEIVLNLTTPRAHAEVALSAIAAGKHVYNEKPLALTRREGRAILDAAAEKDVLVGAAPDTFLGPGLQTCRAVLDDDRTGRAVGATAFMMIPGHESWHPSPAFYYQKGGGPMLDMGPYYLTALVSLLGPVRRVTGSARATRTEREITSQPLNGQRIKVEVPTHVVGVLEFANGAVGTIITSFDVHAHELPFMEIYGTGGTISLPDPNTFDGPVRFRAAGLQEWEETDLVAPHSGQMRGLGVVDLARAIRENRMPRASGEMAFHVLDIMQAVHEASETGQHIDLQSTCTRPDPLN